MDPMLATAMPEGRTVDDYASCGWVLEEKFDGHRLMVTVAPGGIVSASTRTGAGRQLPADIARDLSGLPVGEYDGELYVPGGTSTDVTRLDQADDLRLVLFDMPIDGKTLDHRHSVLSSRVACAIPSCSRVSVAEQWPVYMDTVEAIWARGGEGCIIKRLSSMYLSGRRSPDWIKVKRGGAAVLTLSGFGAGKRGPHSTMLLRHDDGRETSVKVGCDALRDEIGECPESYIGRRVAIAHKGATPGGLWRHPSFDHFAE